MSVYLRARSKLDLVSNQGCSSCHVCIPLHYSFVTQCVKVFSQCGFRHNSVCVSVQWHGLKKRIKLFTILCIFLSNLLTVFAACVVPKTFIKPSWHVPKVLYELSTKDLWYKSGCYNHLFMQLNCKWLDWNNFVLLLTIQIVIVLILTIQIVIN